MFFRILFPYSIARNIQSVRFQTPPLDSYSANDPSMLSAYVVQWQNIRILFANQSIFKGSILGGTLFFSVGLKLVGSLLYSGGNTARKVGILKNIWLWYLLSYYLKKTARHFVSFLTDATVLTRLKRRRLTIPSL